MIKQFLGKLPRKPAKPSEASNHPSFGPKSSDLTMASMPTLDSAPSIVNATEPNGNSATNNSYDALPALRDIPRSYQPNLFAQKLDLCCVVFDFTNPTQNLKEKDVKRQTLLELVDFFTSTNGKFAENAIQDAVKMVSANLFGSKSPQPRESKASEASFEAEEEESSMDPSWPHLQLVYEFFLRLVLSPDMDAKLAKRYLDHSFVLKLLDLFDSGDPREREYLKTILHRVYGKFMVHRPFIRKAINNIFFRFIFETERHNGITEILEVLGSIINGFALPLKEEHKLFLVRALIPLHKPRGLATYQQQLSFCVSQFLEKDCKLADDVVRGLLKYWPVTSSSKEVVFLGELEEVLEATQPAEFQRCMVPLFRRIARCLSSFHFQVAERALLLWNNEHIEGLIGQNRRVILPIIFRALEDGRNHWNQVVQSLTLNVRKTFSEADPELFEKCLRKYHEDESKAEETKRARDATWERLEEIAAAASKSGGKMISFSN